MPAEGWELVTGYYIPEVSGIGHARTWLRHVTIWRREFESTAGGVSALTPQTPSDLLESPEYPPHQAAGRVIYAAAQQTGLPSAISGCEPGSTPRPRQR